MLDGKKEESVSILAYQQLKEKMKQGVLFPTIQNDVKILKFNDDIAQKFNAEFLAPFEITLDEIKLNGICIGSDDNNIWFWVDNYNGITCWDEIVGDIQNSIHLKHNPFIQYPTSFVEWVQTKLQLDVSPRSLLSEIFKNLDCDSLDTNEYYRIGIKQQFFQTPETFLAVLKKLLAALPDFLTKQECNKTIKSIFNQNGHDNKITILSELRVALIEKLEKIDNITKRMKIEIIDVSANKAWLDQSKNLKDIISSQLLATETILTKELDICKNMPGSINIEEYESIEKIINNLINLIGDYAIDFGLMPAVNVCFYDQIYKNFAEFLYNNPDSNQEKKALAICVLNYILLMQQADQEIEIIKKSCYLRLLDEDIQPSEYEHETFCELKPEKFIAMSTLVISILKDRLKICKNHNGIQFEMIKLYNSAAKAYDKLDNVIQKNENSKAAVNQLTVLLECASNNLFINYAKNYFIDDFNVCITLASYYYSLFSEVESGILFDKYLLRAKEILEKDIFAIQIKYLLKYIFLVLQNQRYYSESECIKLVSTILKSNVQDAVAELNVMTSNTVLLMFVLSKSYYELALNENCKTNVCYMLAKKWIERYIDKGPADVEAFYLYYMINKKMNRKPRYNHLFYACELGHVLAIQELHLLDTPDAHYILGTLYLDGKHVPFNAATAASLFKLSGTIYARLKLIKMMIYDQIKVNVNPIKALAEILYSEKLKLDINDRILEILEESLQLNYQYYDDTLRLMTDIFANHSYSGYENWTPNKKNFHSLIKAVTTENISKISDSTLYLVLNFLLEYHVTTKIFSNENFVFIANVITTRNDVKVLYLSICTPFLDYLQPKQIFNALDSLKKSSDLYHLAKLINVMLLESVRGDLFLEWLEQNQDVLCGIFEDVNCLACFEGTSEWINFINKLNVRTILTQMGLINDELNSTTNNASVSFFAKPLDNTILLQRVHKVYLEKKSEFTTLIAEKKRGWRSEPHSEIFKFYQKIAEDLNEVKCLSELTKLAEKVTNYESQHVISREPLLYFTKT